MKKLSDYLYEHEYRCRCCEKLPPQFDINHLLQCYMYLFDKFDDLRREWGKPLYVTSGYRCPKHNKEVGGSDMSAHVFGLALDIGFKTADDVGRFVTIAKEVAPDLRLGWRKYLESGQNFVHIDDAFFVWPRPTHDFAEGVEW